MKRLIVCCDGTWNRADQECPTNVVQVYNALAKTDAEGNAQVACYLEGVGTKRRERVLGGGLGVGLSRNVQAAYRFLVENYEPGDELYFFGFSRGAFTARSTAGLVRNSGILRPECRGQIEAAYKLYRSRRPRKDPSSEAAKAFRARYSHPDLYIQFVGVWDTVGALGIPIDGFRPPLISRLWTFHDTTLSSYVRHAYHAVSIDERRRPFKPTLWVEKEDGSGAAEGQTVEQVWFSGVHSDVGGGYPDSSLADLALLWMVGKAKACGLAFEPFECTPDPCGEEHDSLSFAYKLLRPFDRELKAPEGVAVGPWLASAARTRHGTIARYRPKGLDRWLAERSDDMPVP